MEKVKKLKQDEKYMKGYLQYIMSDIKYFQKKRAIEIQKLEKIKKAVDDLLDSIKYIAEFAKDDITKDNVKPEYKEVVKFLESNREDRR